MLELIFLEQEDLLYVRPQLWARIRNTNPVLERGYVIVGEAHTPECALVVNSYGRRYKVESRTHDFSRDSETRKVLPTYITNCRTYKGSFAFNQDKERKFFDALREYYELKIIDANKYLRLAELAGQSKKELGVKVGDLSQGLRGKTGEIIGSIVGASHPEHPVYGATLGAAVGGGLATILSHLKDLHREKHQIMCEIDGFLHEHGLNLS